MSTNLRGGGMILNGIVNVLVDNKVLEWSLFYSAAYNSKLVSILVISMLTESGVLKKGFPNHHAIHSCFLDASINVIETLYSTICKNLIGGYKKQKYTGIESIDFIYLIFVQSQEPIRSLFCSLVLPWT